MKGAKEKEAVAQGILKAPEVKAIELRSPCQPQGAHLLMLYYLNRAGVSKGKGRGGSLFHILLSQINMHQKTNQESGS